MKSQKDKNLNSDQEDNLSELMETFSSIQDKLLKLNEIMKRTPRAVLKNNRLNQEMDALLKTELLLLSKIKNLK